MAATIASLGSAFTTTAGNKTVTATPTVGDLIVIITVSTGVTTTLADNGTGGTYTQVGSTQTGFSTSGNLQMWVRNNIIASAASTVYTATQTSSTGGGLVVLRVTGVTATGSAAVRSSGGQSTGTAGTTPAPVLSLTPLNTNAIITAVASANTVAGSVLVQRIGYTEDFDNVYSTPATALEVNHLAAGETSATLTQGGTSTTAFASQSIELIVNQSPTTALNTPADTATGISTTPTLNFTGTDADSDAVEYEVQLDTGSAFDVLDSYSESNRSAIWQIDAATTGGNRQGTAQSFTGNGQTITGVKFFLIRGGIPTGLATAKIYAHSGVYGTSSVPTGVALATSNTLDVATVPLSPFTLISLTFATPFTTVNGTNYVVSIEYSGGDASNYLGVGVDATSPTHSGNNSTLLSGTWTAVVANDLCFYLMTNTTPLLDKLSTVAAGFTAGHPFASGVANDFTVQAGDTLANSTLYYWRVRAIDPSGTNTYGAWATTQSFTTTAGVAAIPNKIYSAPQAVNRSNTY